MTCLPYYVGIAPPLHIVFFLINIICAITSVTGNSLTVFVIYKKPQLQVAKNWLLAALAMTDFMAGVVPQPMFGTYLAFFHQNDNCVLEKSIVFMSAMSCSASLLLLCGIARDRYLQVTKGLRYNEFTNQRQIICYVIGCWLASLAIASTFMITIPGPGQYLGFGFFSSLQFCSFIYITITYVKIQRFLLTHFKRHRETMIQENQTSKELRQERSHNLTLLIIIILFAMVWLPFMGILITGTVYQIRKERPGPWLQNGFVWTAILTYVNGAINPLIYAVRYREMGIEMKKQIRRMLRRIIPQSTVAASELTTENPTVVQQTSY